jgi:transposase InsO family protein
MQEEVRSQSLTGAEGEAARVDPGRLHTAADHHGVLRSRVERPSAFDEREAARVPLEGPIQEGEVLNNLVEDALTPGPELDDEAVSPKRFFAGRRKGSLGKGKKLVKPEDAGRLVLTPSQRLLLLDTWRRSGLPAGDFAGLVNVSKHTLYAWKKAFDEEGPAGLMDKPRGAPRGMKLPELTKRTILMLKEANPSWGCQRISDMLLRGPALPASPSTVAKVLHESGYQLVNENTQPHPDKVRSFERAKPNQLWQSDLFTFVLKRQNRRVYLVAFMDDHSRFIVSYGLHASQSAALVLECLRAGIASYGSPQEVLTDNGSQYITWRGKSAFSRELEKRGIQHVVASPRRPQTLGKVERFWGTLWRECLESSVFLDMGDAQKRIGLFIDHYNFQRPHQGLEGLVPADRFFGAAPDVLRTLKERVTANALELARNGTPKTPFYLTGSVGGKGFSVHAEGERVILTRQEGEREEVDLTPPAPQAAPQPKPEPQPEPELPQPVCPQGVVDGELGEAENLPEPEPGTSALDEHFPPLEEGGVE